MFKICNKCKKRRLFVKRQRIWVEPLHQFLTSQEELCRKCIKNIKNANIKANESTNS